jgi:Ca2+-binding RTX toxin-like protein
MADDNTKNTALNITLTPTIQTWNNFVNSNDPVDYYKFTLNKASKFNLTLTELTADANVSLLRYDSSTVFSSALEGTTTETINLANLAAGTYYVKIYPDTSTDNTGYAVNISAVELTILPNNPPTGKVTINDTTPTEGQTLTVNNTLADADGLGVITYTWKTGTTVLGTGNNYTVTANETGKTIQVIASYNDLLGNSESVSSAETSAITMPSAGFDISSGGDFVTNEDGDTAVFNVKLTTAPNRDVSVTFSSSDTTEATINNSTLIFTPTNWSTAQAFTMVGNDDSVLDSNIAYQVKGAVNTIDVNYSVLTIDLITLTNNDNDVAGQTINGDGGGSKNDVLVGTAGDDKIYGLTLRDDLSGRAGNDTIYGGYDNDILFGEEGNDYLWGEQDNDYMEGGVGNDTLEGGFGIDTMKGGTGNDVYYLGYDAKDTIQDGGLATDIDTVIMPYNLTTYTLPTGIENGIIDKGLQNSNLIGNTSNNTLTGNDGTNTLIGAVGRDSLFGGLGNDVLIGGTDNDALTGGTGKDIFKLLDKSVDKITDFKPVDDTAQLENNVFTKLGNNGTLKTEMFKTGTTATDSNDYW